MDNPICLCAPTPTCRYGKLLQALQLPLTGRLQTHPPMPPQAAHLAAVVDPSLCASSGWVRWAERDQELAGKDQQMRRMPCTTMPTPDQSVINCCKHFNFVKQHLGLLDHGTTELQKNNTHRPGIKMTTSVPRRCPHR